MSTSRKALEHITCTLHLTKHFPDQLEEQILEPLILQQKDSWMIQSTIHERNVDFQWRFTSSATHPVQASAATFCKCRPYEISIIIGIVAPMLHGDDFVLQVSTVRNFDYHRNCCSHAAWGCFFFYKCRPYEISIIIGIVAPMLHGIDFFVHVSTVRNFDYHRNCCSHTASGHCLLFLSLSIHRSIV